MPGGLMTAHCCVGHVTPLSFSYQNVNTFSLLLSVPRKVYTGCRKWKSWDWKGWDRCSQEKAWGGDRNLSKRTNKLLVTYFSKAAVAILKGRTSSSVPDSQWVLWNLLKSEQTNKPTVTMKNAAGFPSSPLYFGFLAGLHFVRSLLREKLQITYPHFLFCGSTALQCNAAHSQSVTTLPPSSRFSSALFSFCIGHIGLLEFITPKQ